MSATDDADLREMLAAVQQTNRVLEARSARHEGLFLRLLSVLERLSRDVYGTDGDEDEDEEDGRQDISFEEGEPIAWMGFSPPGWLDGDHPELSGHWVRWSESERCEGPWEGPGKLPVIASMRSTEPWEYQEGDELVLTALERALRRHPEGATAQEVGRELFGLDGLRLHGSSHVQRLGARLAGMARRQKVPTPVRRIPSKPARFTLAKRGRR